MLGFKLEKDKIREIITVFANQYNIPQALLQNIIKIVDEYEYDPNIEVNKLDNFDLKVISAGKEEHSYMNSNENEKDLLHETSHDGFENYYDILDK